MVTNIIIALCATKHCRVVPTCIWCYYTICQYHTIPYHHSHFKDSTPLWGIKAY